MVKYSDFYCGPPITVATEPLIWPTWIADGNNGLGGAFIDGMFIGGPPIIEDGGPPCMKGGGLGGIGIPGCLGGILKLCVFYR